MEKNSSVELNQHFATLIENKEGTCNIYGIMGGITRMQKISKRDANVIYHH
jgi:hypothetical protein